MAELHETGPRPAPTPARGQDPSQPTLGWAEAELSGGLRPGLLLAERYRIVRLLGQGGMGQVYEAEDLEFGEPVALKMLHPQIAADVRLVERLKRELLLAR